LETISNWLETAPEGFIGVTGLGGFGKSTLVAKVYESSQGFADKFWVDLSRLLSFSELARRALFTWGDSAEQVGQIEEPQLYLALISKLQQQRYLLVLDNLESVLTSAGEWQSSAFSQFLQHWLSHTQQSQVIVTSRERPAHLAGGRWLALQKGLSDTEGAALLWQRGVRGSEADLERVSGRVGGYPLSLMLLSGWLVAEEADPQVSYLPPDLWHLAGIHRGEAQISIEQIFNWSRNRLDEHLRQVLGRVSVFRQPFNREAATCVMESPVTDDDLKQLTHRSLLIEQPGRDRFNLKPFWLQPQVQELAQRQQQDLTQAHRQAIAYYQQHLQPLQQQTQRQTEKALLREYVEIFFHHCDLGEYAPALMWLHRPTVEGNQYSTLDFWMQLAGYQDIRETLYRRLVNQWQPNPEEKAKFADSQKYLGDVLQFLKQCDAAIELYDEAIATYQQVGARLGYANALQAKADVLQFLKQCDAAIELYDEAIATYQQVGARLGYANALLGRGSLLEDRAAALEQYAIAQAIYVSIDDRYSQGRNLFQFISQAQLQLGQKEAAIESLNRAAELGEAIGFELLKEYALQKIEQILSEDES
jgi:tetratricopeptide (TPR) repeat protein